MKRPEILQLVPVQHAADVIFKSHISCLSQGGRGRLIRQEVQDFWLSKCQGARFLAINVCLSSKKLAKYYIVSHSVLGIGPRLLIVCAKNIFFSRNTE